MAFIVLNNAFNLALPAMGLSVLSKEIAKELDLSIVQIGMLWGSGSILSILSGLLGGAVVDKLGAKRILTFSSLLVGVVGVVRGFSWDFSSIVMLTTILGLITPMIMLSNFKVLQAWFSSKQLILANGILSAGMAFGFLMGSQFSGTYLAPILGGWRGVLVAYSIGGILLSIPWIFLLKGQSTPFENSISSSLRGTIGRVLQVRNIWFLGLALFGINGSINGILGYLPLYLRNLGWDIFTASSAMTVFHLVSMIFTIPIVLYSTRWFTKKNASILAGMMITSGIALLAFLSGPWVWLAVILGGFSRDGFMALLFTQVYETDGIDPRTVGTAAGLVMTLNGIGSILAPPVGNYFESFSAAAPFGFWATLAFFGVVCLLLLRKNPLVPV